MTLSINGKTYEAGELIAYIEKLEKENLYYKDIIETNTAEWEEQGQRVVALEKENAELKKMCHESDEDNNKLRENIPLLAEAKEFLEICLSKARGNITPSWSELIADIEQFLSKVKNDR